MEYKTVGNLKIPQNLSPEKQAVIDEIASRYAAKNREINKDNLKNMGRIALGSLVSGASFHPILNIPYVGTGLGGAMYDAGQAIVEGDKLGDIAKRAGRGFAIGETVGAVPYVGKGVNKLSGGKIGSALDSAAQKVAANPAVQKAYDALMSDVKAFNPNKQTVYHGSPYDFEKFSNEAIGTGEGAQAHGYGHYAALDKNVAESNYADRLGSLYYKNDFIGNRTQQDLLLKEIIDNGYNNTLTKYKQTLENLSEIEKKYKQGSANFNEIKNLKNDAQHRINIIENIDTSKIKRGKGQVYKLSIPKDDVMLREDLFYKEQNPQVQNAIKKLYEENWENYPYNSDLTQILYTDNTKAKYGQNAAYKEGRSIYDALTKMTGSEQEASKLLNKYGIKGISYNGGIDGEARVIFNPDDIDIVRKYYNQPNLKDIYNKFINSGTFAGAITNP